MSACARSAAMSSRERTQIIRSAQVTTTGGMPGRFIGGISGRVLCIGTWYAVWARITAMPGSCGPASWLVGQ